jgi:hypothetical protein
MGDLGVRNPENKMLLRMNNKSIGGFRGSLFNFNREYNNGDTKFKKPLLNGKNGMVMK